MLAKIKPYLRYRYFLYFYALNASWPSTLPFIGWLPPFKIGMMLVAVLSVIYALMRGGKLPAVIKAMFAVQLFSFMIYAYIHSDSSYITRCMVLISAFSLLVIQARRRKMEFVDTQIFWLALQAVMGGIGFVLAMIGILKPFSTFLEFDGHIGLNYGLFTTTVAGDDFLRVAGFFDEPGAFSFWGMASLFFNKLFINNKKIEKILIVGLISTISMAYFIILPIYGFLFYRQRMKRLIVPILVFILALKGIASFSPTFDNAIFGRFKVDETTGRLEGDNRSHHAEFCKSIWLEHPIFGAGGKGVLQISKQQGKFAGANPYTFLAMDGIFGQLVLFLPLIYIFYLGLKKRKFAYVGILLFLVMLQRPYDPTQLLYPLIFFTICFEGYRDVYLPKDSQRSDFITE